MEFYNKVQNESACVSKKLHSGEMAVFGGVCLFYLYRTREGRNKMKFLIGKHSHIYFKTRTISMLKKLLLYSPCYVSQCAYEPTLWVIEILTKSRGGGDYFEI